MIELESLPLPDDWRVFKTRGQHSPEEINCITALFADDPRLEEFGVAFWIGIIGVRGKSAENRASKSLKQLSRGPGPYGHSEITAEGRPAVSRTS